MKTLVYWSVTAALIGCGLLAIFSIGLPFLVLGLVLTALWPVRSRRLVFLPVVLGVIAFFAAGILFLPLGCKTTATLPGGARGPTICSNALGIDYSGEGQYQPPLWPALAAGAAVGIAVGIGTRVLLTTGTHMQEP